LIDSSNRRNKETQSKTKRNRRQSRATEFYAPGNNVTDVTPQDAAAAAGTKHAFAVS